MAEVLQRVMASARYRLAKRKAPPRLPFDGNVRRYGSYEDYVAHQRSKLAERREFAEQMDAVLEAALPGRFEAHGLDLRGRSVLCLAARLGGEVRAFRGAGAFAVGLDLNPGANNAWVLRGDFHHLDYPDGAVDVVFTNSLDHALDLGAIVAEVRRVLASDGVALLEVIAGTAEGAPPAGRWEARTWETSQEVIDAFAGFEVRSKVDFDEPWQGVSYLLSH